MISDFLTEKKSEGAVKGTVTTVAVFSFKHFMNKLLGKEDTFGIMNLLYHFCKS